jgi:hypothetical protein
VKALGITFAALLMVGIWIKLWPLLLLAGGVTALALTVRAQNRTRDNDTTGEQR